MKILVCLIYTCLSLVVFAQDKQGGGKQVNVTGSDIYADAPWRMEKYDSTGNLAGIPVHVFIHDADVLGYNAELISISIYIKNAEDLSFGQPILFNTYTDSAFLALFSSKSLYSPVLDIQSFDASLPVKSSLYTISFTSNNCSWPDNCTYTDITHDKWYFTVTIPPEKLIGFNDIVDIKVYFNLNWQTDRQSMLRVFRYPQQIPTLDTWYRGDTHVHTMYTANNAEIGFPLFATREAAKSIGLDWITTTDHSCDFDNYGTSLNDNWQRLGADVLVCNQSDSDFVFIRGIEVSLNNSNSDVVHLLAYPNDTLPFSMPFLGDGNGDLSTTSKTIDDILFTLSENGGFAYAAHPFAGGDKLSSLVDGGIWNISDPLFFPNNTPIPGNDVVICNTTTVPSDVYSVNTQQHLFKTLIKGGQLWNSRYSMGTTDEYMNPWDIEYSGSVDAFVPYDTVNTLYHLNRFKQNLEVTKFLNKRGLMEKNINPLLQSYRFFMTAGSDAHGSFNYSNTEFVMGLVNDINDNALGKISTLVYCPYGMGENGKNVLIALRNGRAILSDGPIVAMGIDTLAGNLPQFVCGDEALMTFSQYQNARIIIDAVSSAEYGAINSIVIFIGTVNGEIPILLNNPPSLFELQQSYSLDSLVQSLQGIYSINDNEYFYIRAELKCLKNYGSLNTLYYKTTDMFSAYTNPVWLIKPVDSSTSIAENNSGVQSPIVSPNPYSDNTLITFYLDTDEQVKVEVFNIQGKLMSEMKKNFHSGKNFLIFDEKKSGLYMLRISYGNKSYYLKVIKT